MFPLCLKVNFFLHKYFQFWWSMYPTVTFMCLFVGGGGDGWLERPWWWYRIAETVRKTVISWAKGGRSYLPVDFLPSKLDWRDSSHCSNFLLILLSSTPPSPLQLEYHIHNFLFSANYTLKGDFCCCLSTLFCCPSESTVSEDAGIEPRLLRLKIWQVKRSNHSDRSQPYSARSHLLSARYHPHYAISHLLSAIYTIHTMLYLIYSRLDIIGYICTPLMLPSVSAKI